MSHKIHKYYRTKIGDNYVVYKCGVAGCTHYVPPELLVDRYSICWRCGEEFVITKAAARLAKPHCVACTKVDSNLPKAKREDKVKIIDIEQFIEEKLT